MKLNRIFRCLVIAVMLAVPGIAASGQDQTVAAKNPKGGAAQDQDKKAAPLLKELRGINIGMTADEVKDKLGKPKIDDQDGFYYVFSDDETMQVRLDADNKVMVASMTLVGNDTKAPEVVEVFGANAAVMPAADGKVYKLVRYPDAGYWVSYSRIMLANGPMTTITIQRID